MKFVFLNCMSEEHSGSVSRVLDWGQTVAS